MAEGRTPVASSQALIKPDTSGRYQQSKITKQHILDEDTYVEAISYIIERDFFPNLTKLKAQQEYLDAYEKGDLVRLQSAAAKLAELAGQKSKGKKEQTGKASATPRGVRSTPYSTRSGRPKSQPSDDLAHKVDLNLSLDQFQNKYTSEDNASFLDLIEKVNQRKRDNYKWLYDKETHQLRLEGPASEDKLLTDGGSTSMAAPDTRKAGVNTWKFKAQNTLMYHPQTSYQHDGDKVVRGEEKAIVYHNTSLDKDTEEIAGAKMAPSMENLQKGFVTPWRDIAASETSSDTPTIRGYKYVEQTPTIDPSSMDTPLMTWGTIEGTPMLIRGGEETPGPEFRLPPTSRRDELAKRLSDKASQSLRRKAAAATSSHRAGDVTLSPAAQRLMSKTGIASRTSLNSSSKASGISANTPTFDASLRASYGTPQTSRSP
ncbi:hypothetical protein BZG36_00801 [Bifiguratus adelaidae]|uniref:Protein DGCR14 n=1 Tax=Bifiguratus adelaidae TaxID=1938954 RepID=A0A261Y6K6_9FUNG|nr:hypothetical protein BZG36_00801 [Bifiguratus adelaidae]